MMMGLRRHLSSLFIIFCFTGSGNTQESNLIVVSGPQTVSYGQNLTLQCTITDVNSTVSELFWMLNEENLCGAVKNDLGDYISVDQWKIPGVNAGNFTKNSSQITIQNIDDEFKGLFYCFVKTEKDIVLQANYNNTIQPVAKVSKEGDNITLMCLQNSSNKTTINQTSYFNWFKDDVLISWGDSVVNTVKFMSNNLGWIEIFSATPQDIGEYRCTLNNKKIRTFNVSITQVTTITPSDSTTLAGFLHGNTGYAFGISIGIIIILIILITTCLQREFPVTGYSSGSLEATKDFILCRACRKGYKGKFESKS